MRLLNVSTKELKEFHSTDRPPYAILSHTWGKTEITLPDVVAIWHHHHRHSDVNGIGSGSDSDSDISSRNSHHPLEDAACYYKINQTCEQARHDGYQWVWVDTCCIDKTSSSELSEAINSMFAWYQEAAVCYAYLADVSEDGRPSSLSEQFVRSRWFTRGWTLQELLAPRRVIFFNSTFTQFGTRSGLSRLIEQATGIDRLAILNPRLIRNASISRRMSWAVKRETTRTEDRAYSLLGIFGVNMPLLYGEGENAFARLQEEIMKNSEDHSMFAWGALQEIDISRLLHNPEAIESLALDTLTALAPSPDDFTGLGDLAPAPTADDAAFMMTNRGLQIKLRLIDLRAKQKTNKRLFLGVLSCQDRRSRSVGILLRGTQFRDVLVRSSRTILTWSPFQTADAESRTEVVYIARTPRRAVKYVDGSVVVRADDLFAPGYKVIDVQGINPSWVEETRTLKVSFGLVPRLSLVAILTFYNRGLRLGFLVSVFFDYSGKSCAAEISAAALDCERQEEQFVDLARETWEHNTTGNGKTFNLRSRVHWLTGEK